MACGTAQWWICRVDRTLKALSPIATEQFEDYIICLTWLITLYSLHVTHICKDLLINILQSHPKHAVTTHVLWRGG